MYIKNSDALKIITMHAFLKRDIAPPPDHSHQTRATLLSRLRRRGHTRGDSHGNPAGLV